MLIYEKKVEENDELVRHLFGTEGNIPSEDDVQLSYKDASGTAVSDLTVTSKLLDDGHGGIKTEDGSAVNVWLGDKNIVPGNLESTKETPDEETPAATPKTLSRKRKPAVVEEPEPEVTEEPVEESTEPVKEDTADKE